MGNLVDDVAEMIRRDGKAWNFPLSPEEVGRHLMRSLPDVKEVVVLHSNPGPEHVFVDQVSDRLIGVIDLGDAYFSHTVNDLRRFRAPADRQAVLDGYLQDAPVSTDFMAAWRVACGVADMVTIAYSPENQTAAQAELTQLLNEIE